MGRRVRGPRLEISAINSVGFMIYDKQAGPFALDITGIESVTAR